MFTLSIALLGLALIAAMFALLGVAGGTALVAAIIAAILAVISMIAYWRRRPDDGPSSSDRLAGGSSHP